MPGEDAASRELRVPFVPDGFEPPRSLEVDGLVLEPLAPEHNERDYEAWSSSIAHIRASPGWTDRSVDDWPAPMALEENLVDLELHARHFREREGFTYTVLDRRDGTVVGCVYVYPDRSGVADAAVRSWVRASRSELDVPLWRVVRRWLLSDAWPFSTISYAARATERTVA